MFRIFRFQGSLRANLVLGFGAMLLPLLLLGGSTLFLLHYTTSALEEVVEEAIEEMHPVMYLQTRTLAAAMPPNDYLIHGETAEKEKFARLTRELDQAFDEALAGPFGLGEERDLVRAAREEWRKAKAIALTLLALPDPVGNPAAGREMERMDTHIDRAENLLGQVHETIRREAGEARAWAHAARRWAYLLIAAIFIAAITIAMVTAIALARSILYPMRELETEAEHLGAGDLSHRVKPDGPDELRRLAQTFNAMVEQLQNSRAALEERATHDGLTGLANHREFQRQFGKEIERARRYGHPIALLMLDLDHFKAVNDTYGHLAGDAVLHAAATRIRQALRLTDLPARYGGEEFAVILPETTIAGALILAERARHGLADAPIPLDDGREIAVTVSIGVACYPDAADNPNELVECADLALYAAKEEGRNRVVIYRDVSK